MEFTVYYTSTNEDEKVFAILGRMMKTPVGNIIHKRKFLFEAGTELEVDQTFEGNQALWSAGTDLN